MLTDIKHATVGDAVPGEREITPWHRRCERFTEPVTEELLVAASREVEYEYAHIAGPIALKVVV